MAYTNVWTTAAPLDTQAANQGAVDFRATKLDVMQRIASFGAGTLAARPTPEATSASADWTGVMYWATDTSQVFRWNGSAWIDISNVINPTQRLSDLTTPTITNPGITTDVNKVTIPGSFTTGSIVRVDTALTVNPSTTFDVAVSINGANFGSQNIAVSSFVKYSVVLLAISTTSMRIYLEGGITAAGITYFQDLGTTAYVTGTPFTVKTVTGANTGTVTGQAMSATLN